MPKLDYQSGKDALRERPRHRVLLIVVAFVSIACTALWAFVKLALAGKMLHGMLGLGLIFIAGTLALIFYAALTKRWPTALADVELLTLWEFGDDGPGYSVAIRYRYTIAGTEFTGTRLDLVECSNPFRSIVERKLQSIRSRLDERGRLLIHHHPTQPHRSVVNAGAGLPVIACFLFAVVWTALVGLVMLL